jgi:hypothetical protein
MYPMIVPAQNTFDSLEKINEKQLSAGTGISTQSKPRLRPPQRIDISHQALIPVCYNQKAKISTFRSMTATRGAQ